MAASARGRTPVVRYLARSGCSLSRVDGEGHTALSFARGQRHHDTARLIEDILSAGGWRAYATACRMAYVRIRHEVSKTYAVLDDDHDDRELYQFLFGRNRTSVDAAAASYGDERLDEARPKKPKAMHVLPDCVFSLVCRFLE